MSLSMGSPNINCNSLPISINIMVLSCLCTYLVTLYIIILWGCETDFTASGLLKLRPPHSIPLHWIFNFVVALDSLLHMYLPGKPITRWHMVIFTFCMEGFQLIIMTLQEDSHALHWEALAEAVTSFSIWLYTSWPAYIYQLLVDKPLVSRKNSLSYKWVSTNNVHKTMN